MRFGPRRTIGKGLAGFLLCILAATTILPSARAADTGTDGSKPLSGIVDIAYSYGGLNSHGAALASDGTVWYWTDNGEAKRGPVVKDATQLTTDLVLKKDGTVWAWDSESGTVAQVEGLGGIVKIGAGHWALDRSGKLWVWGKSCEIALATQDANRDKICSGAADQGDLDRLNMPALAAEGVKDADISTSISILMDNGDIIRSYNNNLIHYGRYAVQLPDARKAAAVSETWSDHGQQFIVDNQGAAWIIVEESIEQVKRDTRFVSVSAGGGFPYHALATDAQNQVWEIAYIFGNSSPKVEAVKLKGIKGMRKVISRAVSSGLALTEDGHVLYWGTAEPDWLHESTSLAADVHPQPVTAAISVTWNGKPMSLSAAPVIRDGAVLVPMRELFEAFGATVAYKDGIVSAAKGSRAIKLTVYSKTAVVDGRKVALGTAPTYVGGKTYVPLRFLSEALGAKVAWEAERNNAAIVLPAG